ncbi:AAA family ATPase [Helicobacter didelphidarum]|nr:AAA family ATPase [Helicobacter didelphidarum]
MIEDIIINNFRAIKHLELKGFKKINIFVGKANIGKTSVLEAIYVYLRANPEAIFPISESRNMLNEEDCFEGFFYNYDLTTDIVLVSGSNTLKISPNKNIEHFTLVDIGQRLNINGLSFEINKQKMSIVKTKPREFNLNIKRDNKTPIKYEKTEFISSAYSVREKILIVNLKDIIESKEKRKQLEKVCKDFSKDIVTLRFSANKIMVEQENLSHDISLRLMGNGFQSYITILVAILANCKYIIIDEIENGLHFESIALLLRAMLHAKDVQFFVTTHNEEFLKKLNEVLEQDENIAIFNLYRKDEELKAIHYSQEDFILNIEQNNEIRD